MKIILISGKAQHGKDTTAQIIKNELTKQGNKVIITHFADLVKFTCEKYFDWNGEKDEAGRTLLQYVGTDVVRTINPNYWADFVINFLSMFPEEWDYVLIPDCRFKNELELWGGWDTVSVRVIRENFKSILTTEQLNHPSETALDDYEFDYYIHNDGDLKQLENEVDKFIDYLGG